MTLTSVAGAAVYSAASFGPGKSLPVSSEPSTRSVTAPGAVEPLSEEIDVGSEMA